MSNMVYDDLENKNPEVGNNENTYEKDVESTDMTAIADIAFNKMFDKTKRLMETLVGYKEMIMMYNCALKEVRTKFEVLNSEFKIRYQRNPISYINTRLKRASSITKKLLKKNIPCNLKSIEENIHDVAGIRVVCSYIDDIYEIADALLRQDDVVLISKKDYIAEPKPNGYRSLHLIIEIPVFFSEHKKNMKVEVQIRTIAMDFWASLEHQLKYKKDIPEQDEIIKRLKACAEISNATDIEMQNIRKEIQNMTDVPTEEDILFDKFSRVDMPFE